jgi:hypothetical protein
MRYIINITCQSDVDMEAIFNAHLPVVLNSLHHEPIRLVGGGRKSMPSKSHFIFTYATFRPRLLSLRHCVLYAMLVQTCCVSGLGVGFSSFVTVLTLKRRHGRISCEV